MVIKRDEKYKKVQHSKRGLSIPYHPDIYETAFCHQRLFSPATTRSLVTGFTVLLNYSTASVSITKDLKWYIELEA